MYVSIDVMWCESVGDGFLGAPWDCPWVVDGFGISFQWRSGCGGWGVDGDGRE
jgi:predicted 3-demethylubiquinone-9 3-methyltransferase (glyoxalase superfamily)